MTSANDGCIQSLHGDTHSLQSQWLALCIAQQHLLQPGHKRSASVFSPAQPTSEKVVQIRIDISNGELTFKQTAFARHQERALLMVIDLIQVFLIKALA